MSTHARLLGELEGHRSDATHDEPEAVIYLDCSCGQMCADAETWKREGPRLTHGDFYVRMHDPRYCGFLEDATSEFLAARGQ